MTIDDLFVLPNCETKTFADIFNDQGTFLYYYLHCGIPTTISNDNVNLLYYLMYAKYGNKPSMPSSSMASATRRWMMPWGQPGQ